MSQNRIAVVGAGIAGLTCAHELQKQGFDIVVFEKEQRVGGRMATRTKGDLPFDIGADHLCGLYVEIKKYCQQFQIPFERVDFLQYRVLRDRKLYSTSEVVSWISRLRLIWQFWRTGKGLDFFNLSSSADLDTDNADHYMRQNTNDEIADYLADPFCSIYQFHRSKELSVAAVLAMFQSQKYQKDDWYLHRMRGGMSALPEALAKELEVKTGVAVQKVEGGEQVLIEYQNTEEFDAVVLATTANVTQKLYTNPSDAQKFVLEGSEYASTISISFIVEAARMPDISIVWVPFCESNTICGYVNESMKGAEFRSGLKTVLSVWLHAAFAQTLLGSSDQEIFEAVKQEFLQACPWFSDQQQLENYDLQKWPEAMPKFSHGHIRRVKEFLSNGQGDNNIYFCGDYLNSPWTEGAMRCGQRVAQEITQRFRST